MKLEVKYQPERYDEDYEDLDEICKQHGVGYYPPFYYYEFYDESRKLTFSRSPFKEACPVLCGIEIDGKYYSARFTRSMGDNTWAVDPNDPLLHFAAQFFKEQLGCTYIEAYYPPSGATRKKYRLDMLSTIDPNEGLPWTYKD